MFQRILIPVDGSAFSEAALRYGMQLAFLSGGTIGVLRVIPISATPAEGLGKADDQLANAQAYVEGWASRLAQSGIDAEPKVQAGEPAPAIVEWASRWDADVVVISSHGIGGRAGHVFGSVAENVVHNAACPVLVIHQRPTEAELLEQEEREESEIDRSFSAAFSSKRS